MPKVAAMTMNSYSFTAMLRWLLLFVPISMSGQVIISNQSLLDSGVNNAIKQYWSVIGTNAQVYSGSQYKELVLFEYDSGHPYFLADDWKIGSVCYDGIDFPELFLLYDIVFDKLVIENKTGNAIEVNKDKINSFVLGEHKFVKLKEGNLSMSLLPTGFFEILYDGDVKVYAKRAKSIQLKTESGHNRKIFKEKNSYYIYKGLTYYPVKGKSSVFKVFAERKTLIKREMEKNDISFKENREFAISQVARYYDESKRAQ